MSEQLKYIEREWFVRKDAKCYFRHVVIFENGKEVETITPYEDAVEHLEDMTIWMLEDIRWTRDGDFEITIL